MWVLCLEMLLYPQLPATLYRDSISDSVREVAMYNMQLEQQLDLERLPAGMEIPTDVQWTSHQQRTQQFSKLRSSNPEAAEEMVATVMNVKAPETVIPGPFARVRGERDSTATPPMREPMIAAHLRPDGTLPETTYAPTEPLSPQKQQIAQAAAQLPEPEGEDSLYNPTAIRDAFNSSLQRRTTPPNPNVPAPRVPRGYSNLTEQRRPKRPTTLKSVTEAEKAAAVIVNGSTSPSKTESSYRTANEAAGEYERTNDSVRPPSVYSYDSIGGEVSSYTERV